MNPKIQEEVPINVYILKKEISKIQKRDTELSLRAGKTEEYLNLFTPLKQKDAEDLEEELRKMEIPRFKEIHIMKVVDTLPESVEELKIVMQGYALTLTKENMQKVVDAVNKHLHQK
jgi:DNA-directed RNA polymerase subunit F